MLFISYDLAVIRQICDRVAVMLCGKLCEIADSETMFADRQHLLYEETANSGTEVQPPGRCLKK